MTYIDFVSKLSPIEVEVMKSSFYEVSECIVNFAETQFLTPHSGKTKRSIYLNRRVNIPKEN